MILSILYPARRVRYSAEVAKAESQREILDTSWVFQILVTTPGLTEDFRAGLNRYEQLDPDTQARFAHLLQPIVNRVESSFEMRQQGLIEDDAYERWMAFLVAITDMPGGRDWWSHVGPMFGPVSSKPLNSYVAKAGRNTD